MDKLTIIKIGGHVIDSRQLQPFLEDLSRIPGKKILVHGGGKMATDLAEKLSIPQKMVEGRRITDVETLKLVTMVYAGWINKTIVATLQASGTNAWGFCGADGDLIRAHKRKANDLDFGFVGDIDSVNVSLLEELVNKHILPVIAPVSHDGLGQLLNTNADTIAQTLGQALAGKYTVRLVYCFEKNGVMRDVNDPASVIKKLNAEDYTAMKEKGIIFAGMVPKLDNAFRALDNGVTAVIIGNAAEIKGLLTGEKGTMICHV